MASQVDNEGLLERLSQLEHDLGKYLRLPFGLLPKEASDAELREALTDALLATRRSAAGVTPAAELWAAFVTEGTEALAGSAAYATLEAAVETALQWQGALSARDPLDRDAIERDMAAVGRAIGALIEEVEG